MMTVFLIIAILALILGVLSGLYALHYALITHKWKRKEKKHDKPYRGQRTGVYIPEQRK